VLCHQENYVVFRCLNMNRCSIYILMFCLVLHLQFLWINTHKHTHTHTHICPMFNVIQIQQKLLNAIRVLDTSSNILPLVINSNWTLICNLYSWNETSNVSSKQATCEQDITESHNRIMPRNYLLGRLSLRDIFSIEITIVSQWVAKHSWSSL
jgi:hypothetical protein